MNDSLPGDWFLHVKKDLNLLKIEMTFDHIRSFSKFTYKKYIQKKIRMFAFQSLMLEKSSQHKCRDVKFEELKIQEYLISSPLTTRQKEMLFQMRTYTYPVFANIPYLVSDLRCPCCFLEEDTMEHTLRCSVIQANCQLICSTNISITDMFSSKVQDQANVTVMFDQAIRRRRIVLQHILTNDNNN